VANILAIGAHPDDIEIGAGGTVAAMIGQGHNVVLCDLTNGEPTPYGTSEKRKAETEKSNEILSVKTRVNLGLENRWLADTKEIRIKIAEVYREYRPDIVLAPCEEDAHPDHVVASRLARASRFIAKLTKTDMAGEPFYPPKMFFYLTMNLKLFIKPAIIFDVSETFGRKIEAVKAFQSQFYEGPAPKGDDLIERLTVRASFMGSQIGVRYGEPFLNLEEIGISSFDDLLP
jgi:bacillithiol biosynthesis deacetylase BshB1